MMNQTFRKYSLQRERKNHLPLKSKFHRGNCRLEHGYFASSRTCQLQAEQKPDSALKILQYQLKDRQLKKTHLDNLKHSLNRRIKAAKKQQDYGLMTALNKELQYIAHR